MLTRRDLKSRQIVGALFNKRVSNGKSIGNSLEATQYKDISQRYFTERGLQRVG